VDHDRFDALSRALAAALARRGALKGLAGAALGGLLGTAAAASLAPACRLAGRSCGAARPCCAGSRCVRGFCRCNATSNFFACDGPGARCVDVATSEEHCGGCGNPPCGANEVCINGGCVDHCESGAKDGDESDTDCGGDRCPKCGPFKKCAVNSDCESDHCDDDRRRCSECSVDAHCTTISFLDTCVDHGCVQCRTDAQCTTGTRCVSNTCTQHCRNGVRDGDETDVDCGGSCVQRAGARCSLGQGCARDGDCKSRVCVGSRCRGCRERADCTDPNFPFCETDTNTCVECKFDINCRDGVFGGGTRRFCVGNRCVACEEDGDCAAPTPACVDNRCVACSEDAHCPEGDVCAGNACVACGPVPVAGSERAGAAQEGTCPGACANGVKDGDESDVDCGGPDCLPCGVGQGCGDDSDCFSSASCVDNVCRDGTRGPCPESRDVCGGDTGGCNFDLRCTCRLRVTSASGPAASFCAHSDIDTVCSSCATDGDCVAVTGPGSACVAASSRLCNCVVEGGRACAPPCPSAA
jgi:Cys-rich repeat protein